MAQWMVQHRFCFAILFASYFVLHVGLRVCGGGGLSYDETEQVFLSQWIQWGYNSQPPLYTWIQSAFFSVFGYHVFALSVLKNALIGGTYLVVFALVYQTTQNTKQAIAGSLGMLMIPQIAWESHRDLSHTVLVTFATALLMFCVVGVRRHRTTVWYVAIGVVSALGMMSKYNFAMVIVAIALSAMTIPRYRECLLDVRMVFAILVAAVLVTPHGVWVLEHAHLASAKTIHTLTHAQTNSYWNNLLVGLKALIESILACVSLAIAVFVIAYRDRFWKPWTNVSGPIGGDAHWVGQSDDTIDATALLIQRYFLILLAMVVALVVSGQGLEFKNRWIQPFVCLLPAYLVLRWRRRDWTGNRSLAPFDENLSLNRIALMGVLAMIAVLAGVLVRQHTRPNRPLANLDQTVFQVPRTNQRVIITPNPRIAGELKLISPDVLVLANDHRHLGRQWFRDDQVEARLSEYQLSSRSGGSPGLSGGDF